MQLKHPVYKSCVQLRKFIVLSILVALAVSLSRQKAKIVMGARKSYIGAWCKKEDSINAATMPWSPHQEQWVQERAAASSEANKREVVLRNNHILCGSKTCSHSQCMTDRPKSTCYPTNSNPHVLVQRSWRCVRGTHREHVAGKIPNLQTMKGWRLPKQSIC